MKLVTFMAPAILCAAISFQALVLHASKKEPGWSQPLFYAFLPGCFLMMAGVMLSMNREISRLRRRIARIEGKRPGAQAAQPVEAGKAAADDAGFDSITPEV